jgi:hypothetical protein
MASRTRAKRAAAQRTIIAERLLELVVGRRRRSVIVRIMRPEVEPVPAGSWICPYEITGLPGRRSWRRAGYGVDEVQALIGALQAARQDLSALAQKHQLLWEGQPDLGFPAMVEGEATPEAWRRQKFRPPRLGKPPIYRYDP